MKTVPVDIVDVSELTRLKAGAKKPEEPAPRKPAPPVEPKPPEKTAALPPPPEPQPEPAEPKVAAPAPPPRPQPRAEASEGEPQPKPRAPEPEPRPKEEATGEPTPPVPVPPARPAHTPRPAPPPAQPKKAPAFDPDRIAALLDKAPKRDSAPARESETRPGEGDPRGLDARMSLSEIDALRAQISRCWNPPVAMLGAEDMAVQLRLALNPDGTLIKSPEILTRGSGMAFLAAADSARRAVLRCQPYDLPISKYKAWRDIKVNFDPREMLGG